MEDVGKWTYSFDGFLWSTNVYDSKELAVNAALKEARIKNSCECSGISEVYVGKCVAFQPNVNVDMFIEDLQDDACDQAGEAAEDYLEDITLADKQKLHAMLTDTFNKWAEETNTTAGFYVIKECSEHKVW